MSKLCQYGCGTRIWWNDDRKGKLKWEEVSSGQIHNYPRCAEILKQQGKTLEKKKQNE